MSTTFRNENTGIEITVSKPAEKVLGPGNIREFVKALTEVMDALGCHRAWVSKRLNALEILVFRKDGWTGTMKVKR